MADVFISYSRKDRDTAQRLASVLEGEGWSVFWDRTIPPGRKFDEYIDEQLTAARCIVVLWSHNAKNSDWVLEEAEEGRIRRILVPALIETVAPPRGFRRIQAADLIGWKGERSSEGYRQLAAAIASITPAPRVEPPAGPAATPTVEKILQDHGAAPSENQWPPDARVRKRRPGWTASEPALTMKIARPWWFYATAIAVAVAVALLVVLWLGQRDDRPREAVSSSEPAASTPEAAGQGQAEWEEVAIGDSKHEPLATFKDCDECPEMVVIPKGSFVMGSPQDEKGRDDDEGPQHRVTMERFAIGRDEVTFGEWDACVAAGGCNRYKPEDRGWGHGSRPVINVSWNDAQAYLDWLSNKTGGDYRLPTEAEWEYAARAGTETPYAFGETITPEQANFGSNVGKTTEVGQYPANAWGLHDMHGNVREWVEDCYHDSYEGAPADGSAWVDKDCTYRVVRGGSWYVQPGVLRSANRYGVGPGIRGDSTGFRVARTLTP